MCYDHIEVGHPYADHSGVPVPAAIMGKQIGSPGKVTHSLSVNSSRMSTGSQYVSNGEILRE